MSLEERTLVVRNFDHEKISEKLLTELFVNFGPLARIVLRPNFAYVEYTEKRSVSYALAMTGGITLHGRRLDLRPKIENDPFYYEYCKALDMYAERCWQDSSYIASFLDKRHLDELHRETKNLKSNELRNRLLKYQKHCVTRFNTWSPYLNRDLVYQNIRNNGRSEKSHYLQDFSRDDSRRKMSSMPSLDKFNTPPSYHDNRSNWPSQNHRSYSAVNFHHYQPQSHQQMAGPSARSPHHQSHFNDQDERSDRTSKMFKPQKR